METDASATLLTRVEFFVTDLDRTIAFYERLGFHLLRRWEGWALIDRGGSRLALQHDAYVRDHDHYFTPQLDQFPRGVGVETCVDVADRTELEALYAVADEEGIVVRELRERPWGATDFRIADPDGYFVRFTTPLRHSGE